MDDLKKEREIRQAGTSSWARVWLAEAPSRIEIKDGLAWKMVPTVLAVRESRAKRSKQQGKCTLSEDAKAVGKELSIPRYT